MSIELMMSSNHLIPFSSCPQSFPASGSFPVSWLFKSVGQYWSFSFNISPSNEYSGLISFRIDWFDLLALQRTLKSLLQHHSLKTSILWCSAFFMVQLSHLYMTPGKTIALTIWTSVDKVMTLSMLSSHHGQKKSPKCSTWMQSQKQQNDLCSFPRQSIQYHSNPSLYPNW